MLKTNKSLKIPVIVASMGLFSPGAFKMHFIKKKAYIYLCRMLGWYKNVTWSATSKDEERDIKRIIGKEAIVDIAQDLPRVLERNNYLRKDKKKGELNVCFLSRIDPQKNTLFVIKQLSKIRGNVELHIYGPKHISDYWAECESALGDVDYKWKYHGEVDSNDVITAFSESDLFFFPTKGENFGHVIIEAMTAGRPVIISDQTPWFGFDEKKIGAVIPLNQEDKFVEVLQKFTDMDSKQFDMYCRNAFDFAQDILKAPIAKEQYRKMFVDKMK